MRAVTTTALLSVMPKMFPWIVQLEFVALWILSSLTALNLGKNVHSNVKISVQNFLAGLDLLLLSKERKPHLQKPEEVGM